MSVKPETQGELLTPDQITLIAGQVTLARKEDGTDPSFVYAFARAIERATLLAADGRYTKSEINAEYTRGREEGWEAAMAKVAADGKAGGEVFAYLWRHKTRPHDFKQELSQNTGPHEDWDVIPLYTRPQQAAQVAQPLAEGQIEEARHNLMPNAWSGEIDAFEAGVRFSERRLGIGKDQAS